MNKLMIFLLIWICILPSFFGCAKTKITTPSGTGYEHHKDKATAKTPLGTDGKPAKHELPNYEHRKGRIIIKAPPGTRVKIKQIKHEFWFGTAISSQFFRSPDNSNKRKYLEILKENFNSAVHENALKWYSTEKYKDITNYSAADTMIKWCKANKIQMRGHCLFWANDFYIQPWVKQLKDESLTTRIKDRITKILKRYKGEIIEYDVNNEMLSNSFYKNRLGESIRFNMFKWCEDIAPNAILYLNDYDILNGKRLDLYEKQIKKFLDAGINIGGIGVQGHFGKRGVSVSQVKRSLDRLAKFNLPIKITEFDINTTDETIKTKGLKDLYTTAFSHPAVDGILMWGFWEGAHWRPDAALWDRDWIATKAANVYRDLIYNKWWTNYNGLTNKNGICEVKVFYGIHNVSIGDFKPRVVSITKKMNFNEICLP